MKQSFSDYLRTLSMGGSFVQRVGELHDECALLTGKEPEEIFVSEQIVQGQRHFLALHFFTASSVFRFDRFVDQFALDIGQLNRASKCGIYKTNFNLKLNPTQQNATMQVAVTWEPIPFALQLWATHTNCVQLLKIVNAYILPKMIL